MSLKTPLRTLEELPKHVNGYRKDMIRWMPLNIILMGFHTWGFVVYRSAYGDGTDETWTRYLTQLKQNCHDCLVQSRRAKILERYLDWVVIENRDALNGPTKVEVRKHFNGWV
ncbi:hypothetical protein CDEST_11308 [Colletotrichum destructivum]|uniref:Transmembrane protein n=1 Tax=Colletotrichum destructivum TaxID=34406 RepID=A0AAX4IST0_9PEZI|nr:hypothetical protein CDEST_11308 [Colletotrichum destructivum]